MEEAHCRSLVASPKTRLIPRLGFSYIAPQNFALPFGFAATVSTEVVQFMFVALWYQLTALGRDIHFIRGSYWHFRPRCLGLRRLDFEEDIKISAYGDVRTVNIELRDRIYLH